MAEKNKDEETCRREHRKRGRASQNGEDVPFGVRALESGVEVKGVWVSRNNSPEPASRHPSTILSTWEHSTWKNRDPENPRGIQQGEVRDGSISNSTTHSARPPRTLLDRSVSADDVSNSRRNTDSTRKAGNKHSRARYYPPVSFARFSNTPYVLRQSSTASTLEDWRLSTEHQRRSIPRLTGAMAIVLARRKNQAVVTVALSQRLHRHS